MVFSHFYYRDQSVVATNPIPESFLSSGLICAALYDSQWHRAKIIDVLDYSVQVRDYIFRATFNFHLLFNNSHLECGNVGVLR